MISARHTTDRKNFNKVPSKNHPNLVFWIAHASFFEGCLTPAKYSKLKYELTKRLKGFLKFKTEIWAHKKLKGFLKNNPCEFQENQTILRSPKILWASFRFLRALRAHKIFDALRATYLASMAQKWCENFSKIGSCYLALRPLHGLVIWLKTDLLWKSHQDLIIANTFCRLHKMCIWTAELEHPLKGQHKDQHP